MTSWEGTLNLIASLVENEVVKSIHHAKSLLISCGVPGTMLDA